ncbi:MAG TPA: ABC transporter ATP-binding protein [Candidatus Cybelea sp.]|nr:ABC transporter ATP-binding protein [Candidatus Cybelea sp.]
MNALLEISGLHLEIAGPSGWQPILRGVDLALPAGMVHGLVGESGAGKTMVAKAVLGIQPERSRISEGAIRFEGQDITHLGGNVRRALFGRGMALIPQDPMSALNPVVRIETQMLDVLRLHLDLSRDSAREAALRLLSDVHIRKPERVLRLYPHELSGGMRQRVLIANAFACKPKLIIADEPTTALDVTVQRQILRLIKDLQATSNTALLFVTHDLGVVAKICDWVSVLHAGRVVESASVEEVFRAPRHEYTRALFAATPRYDRPGESLHPVPPALIARLNDEAAAYDAARAGRLSDA